MKVLRPYSTLYLHLALSASLLLIASSIAGIIAASIVLTGGLSLLGIAGCRCAGSYGLFKTINILGAKKIADQQLFENSKCAAEMKQINFSTKLS